MLESQGSSEIEGSWEEGGKRLGCMSHNLQGSSLRKIGVGRRRRMKGWVALVTRVQSEKEGGWEEEAMRVKGCLAGDTRVQSEIEGSWEEDGKRLGCMSHNSQGSSLRKEGVGGRG